MKDNAPATDPRPAHTSPRRRSLSIRGRLTIAFVLIVLLSAVVVLVSNLVTDVTYSVFDPRIRYG